MFRNVCRLCLGTDDLISIFSDKMADNMKEVIQVTSGVEISRTDTVTQMVCSTCCQVTIKMYQFRTKSIKNDKDLKAKCAGYNIAQLTSTASTHNNKTDPAAAKTLRPSTPHITIKPVPSMPARYQFAHPSVKEVLKKNPNIKLPSDCLKSHVGAYITLLTDEVDEYFKEKNMTDIEIAQLKAEAYDLAFNPKKIPAPRKRKKSIWEEKRDRPITPSLGSKRLRLSTDSSVSSDNDSHLAGKENRKNSVNETTKGSKQVGMATRGIVTKVWKPALTDEAKTIPPKSTPEKPSEVLANASDSIFSSLLTSESAAKKKASSREEITLKSILQSQRQRIGLQLLDDDDDVIDVEGPPSPAPSPTPSDKEPSPPPPPAKSPQTEKSKPSDESATKTVPDKSVTTTVADKSATTTVAEKTVTTTVAEKTVTTIIPDKSVTKTVTDESGTKTVPDEDFQLFTSRPFLKNGVLHMLSNGEPVVISDSEDENNEDIHKDGDNDDAVSEPIVFDLESLSSTHSKLSDTDKTTFTEALRLAPKTVEGSNQPDLSLVALARKTHTLYTCRVCDSQHSSLKELKYHERRTHTKCPFCSKRFRKLANRDEHISNTCLVNRSPVKLKRIRLELTRVDEVEEIKRRYASAFEEFNERETNEEETDETPTETMSEGIILMGKATGGLHPVNEDTHSKDATREERTNEGHLSKDKKSEGNRKGAEQKTRTGVTDVVKSVQKQRKKANDAPVDCDAATADAISELEQFLNYAEIIPVKGKRTSSGNTKSVRESTSRSEDVICISDEEAEANQSTPQKQLTSPQGKTTPQAKQTTPQEKQTTPEESQETSEENRGPPQEKQSEFQIDIEGGEQTINVVNSEILNDINIHDNDFNVLKAILFKNWKRLKTRKEDTVNQIKTSLKDSPILDGNSSRMKIFKNLRKYLHQYKIPIEVKYSPTVSVQYKPTTPAPPVRLTGLWKKLEPQQLKPFLTATPAPTAPPAAKTSAYTVLNGQLGLGMKQVFQNVPITSGPRQTVISNSAPQQLAPQITNVATVQDSNVTTTNLILTPTTVPSGNPPPLILNGAPPLTNSSAPFTNYIVVHGTVLPPSTQGPLPVIESVTSAKDVTAVDQPSMSAVAQLESITNALMPTSPPSDAITTVGDTVEEVVTVANTVEEVVTVADTVEEVANVVKEVVTVPNVVTEVQSTSTATNATQSAIASVQPAIRVRNLKELS